MSSFLPAAENVARQRQNVRRDLKKMEEESRALERHNLVYFSMCCTGKGFNYSKIIVFILLVPL